MANLSEIRVIYRKEIRDTLRDRRTLSAMVVLPILLYPLLMLGMQHARRVQGERMDAEVFKVAVEGDLSLLRGVAGADTLIEWARLPRESVARSEADLWVSLPSDLVFTTDSGTVQIVYNSSNERSVLARRRVEAMFDSLRVQIIAQRARRLGLDLETIDPGRAAELNVASAERMTGAHLSTLVPLLLIMFLFTSGTYAAFDVFAGERERGTLEALLATGAERESLVIGKSLAVLTVSLAAVLLNLLSLVLTLGYTASLIGEGFTPSLPVWTVPLIFALAIPLAVLATAILVLVGSAARTFREAQYFAFPILILTIPTALMGSIPGIDEVWAVYFVPIGNVAVVARQLLMGEVVPWRIIATLATTSLFAWAGMRRAVGILGSEQALAPGRLRSPQAAESASRVRAVFFFVAVDFLLFFYVGVLVQSYSMYLGLLVSLVLLLLVPSLLFLKILGLPIGPTVRWRRPGGRAIVGALLCAPGTYLLAHLSFLLMSRVLPVSERFLEAFAELADPTRHGALATYSVLALAPGVCEEFLFRGVVFGILSRVWGGGRAAVAAAVLFSLFHLSVYRFVPVLLVGLALAAVVWRTGSLIPAMLMHAAYNALGLALARAEQLPVGEVTQIGLAIVSGLLGIAVLRRIGPSPKTPETPEKGLQTPFFA